MNLDDILEKLRHLIISHTGNSSIGYDDMLFESGIDSLSIIGIIVEIEDLFNQEFDISELNYSILRSIRTLGEYVYKRL